MINIHEAVLQNRNEPCPGIGDLDFPNREACWRCPGPVRRFPAIFVVEAFSWNRPVRFFQIGNFFFEAPMRGSMLVASRMHVEIHRGGTTITLPAGDYPVHETGFWWCTNPVVARNVVAVVNGSLVNPTVPNLINIGAVGRLIGAIEREEDEFFTADGKEEAK